MFQARQKTLAEIMNTSQSITKIATALVKAQQEMNNAVKGSNNPFFKKNYADINSVREAVIPALNKHGITAIQPTCVVDGIDYVETILLHESGEYISSLTRIVVDKVNDAQRHGSGLSYARRYSLQSICNIGAEDDDANAATGKKPEFVDLKDTPEAISQAIAALYLCTTLDDLQNWKQTTPEVLVKNKTVAMAAKGQYNKIKGGAND